jgi:hypothetical protein
MIRKEKNPKTKTPLDRSSARSRKKISKKLSIYSMLMDLE